MQRCFSAWMSEGDRMDHKNCKDIHTCTFKHRQKQTELGIYNSSGVMILINSNTCDHKSEAT